MIVSTGGEAYVCNPADVIDRLNKGGKNMRKRELAGMSRANSQQGFTLVELVIVMAILAVLAAIAIPKYNGVLHESKVKSDAVTAAGIVSAARIQETSSGDPVVSAAGSYDGLDDNYFPADTIPTSGGTFGLVDGGNGLYQVTWTPNVGIYDGIAQTVTEGTVFEISVAGGP